MKTSTATPRADLYTRVTERVIADLEHGVRPWLKPWNAGHAAGRITLPLRHNGTPYRGINILLLWGEAMTNGYASPLWMTFKQALALGAHVRKGEHGAMVVYADRFTRTETDADGNGVEREIPFLKAYTVFNVAQIEGRPVPSSVTAGTWPTTLPVLTSSSCPRPRRSVTPRAMPPPRRTS